jgi:hypothetical protein
VDNTRPGLDEWVLYVVKESRVLIEIRESHCFQFQALPGEICVDELLDCASSEAAYVVDGREIIEDLTGRLACRFINKGLGVGVQFGEIDGLDELGGSITVSQTITRGQTGCKRYSPRRGKRSDWSTMVGSAGGVSERVGERTGCLG